MRSAFRGGSSATSIQPAPRNRPLRAAGTVNTPATPSAATSNTMRPRRRIVVPRLLSRSPGEAGGGQVIPQRADNDAGGRRQRPLEIFRECVRGNADVGQRSQAAHGIEADETAQQSRAVQSLVT